MGRPVYRLTGRSRIKRLWYKPWLVVDQLEIDVCGRLFWRSRQDMQSLYGLWKDEQGNWIRRPE